MTHPNQTQLSAPGLAHHLRSSDQFHLHVIITHLYRSLLKKPCHFPLSVRSRLYDTHDPLVPNHHCLVLERLLLQSIVSLMLTTYLCLLNSFNVEIALESPSSIHQCFL
jgi:hypothetical protein